jgi:hypothetical protein
LKVLPSCAAESHDLPSKIIRPSMPTSKISYSIPDQCLTRNQSLQSLPRSFHHRSSKSDMTSPTLPHQSLTTSHLLDDSQKPAVGEEDDYGLYRLGGYNSDDSDSPDPPAMPCQWWLITIFAPSFMVLPIPLLICFFFSMYCFFFYL